MTRNEMKALPIGKLTSSRARFGDLTVLSFAHHSSHINELSASMPDLRKHYRSVKDDPVRAFLVEQQIREVWSRLVDLSRGYWLNQRGRFSYDGDPHA